MCFHLFSITSRCINIIKFISKTLYINGISQKVERLAHLAIYKYIVTDGLTQTES